MGLVNKTATFVAVSTSAIQAIVITPVADGSWNLSLNYVLLDDQGTIWQQRSLSINMPDLKMVIADAVTLAIQSINTKEGLV